jgi:hypothetical protein
MVMAGYVLAWFQGIARIGASIPTLIALRRAARGRRPP